MDDDMFTSRKTTPVYIFYFMKIYTGLIICGDNPTDKSILIFTFDQKFIFTIIIFQNICDNEFWVICICRHSTATKKLRIIIDKEKMIKINTSLMEEPVFNSFKKNRSFLY